MKVKLTAKFIPERTDTMSTEDILREILAYTELTKDAYTLGKTGYHMYSRKAFLDFCDTVLSIARQEVY